MKKLNLIKRLWTDSHEKQKMRSVRRYAAMLLLLVMCVTHAWADNTSDGTARLFFNMGAVNWWTAGTNGDKNFAYFYNNTTNKNAWSAHSVQQTGNYYYVVVPAGTWEGVILTRNNTTTSPTWDNKWNQTGNISWTSGKNYISAFSENSTTATLSTYQLTSTASLSATSTSITTAETSTLTPSLSSNTGYNVIKSTSYSVTTNPGSAGSVTSGGVFSATAAGTYTVTATVTYNAVGFSGITKSATATKDITVTAASTATLTYHENFRTETGNGTGSAPDEEVYAINATATVAGQNTMSWSYYTFSGWNTSQYITGDHYDEDDEFEITENMDLYATWTRSIPMENEDATTNVSTTVYGTYNSTALTTHTNPAKTGYTFGGWWTQVAGGGNYVISPGHVLQASKTNWTDGSGRFIRPSTSTSSLYAKWTQDITLNANTSNHGSGSNTTASVTYKKDALTSITHCTPAAGYKVEGYYTAATDGTKILNADGTFAGSNITVSGDVYIASSQWKHAGATTLYAHYEPKTTVRLYYSNPDNWSTVKAYVWCNANTSDKNAAWSGVEITSNTLVRNGDTYYYYEYYKEDHPNWDRVIFNDGSNQTNNITFSNTTNNGQYNDAKKSEVGSWQDLPAEETVYSVTFYAGNRGAISAKGTAVAKNGNASVNIGATPRALTVTSVDNGYSFDYWETSGSVTVADIYSESTTVSASGTGTVTAHYLANSGWYLHGNVDGATDWCAEDYWPHRWPIDRPYRGVSGVYYRKISSINNGAYFGIHDGSNKYSGNNSESDYSWNGSFHDLVVNTGHCFQASTAFSDKWVVINTTGGTKKIWIQSPTTYYTVTVSNEGSGARGTVVLKEKSYGNLATNEYASGETIRVEIDTVAHYSIKSVKLGDTNVTMTHSSGTKFTGDVVMPASDKTLTVTYTPWYQVKLAASPAAAADAPTAAKTTGGATVNHNDYVISGTSVTFTKQSANGGYTWDHWENNGSGSETGNTYVATISATTTVTAVYTENSYSTTVTVSPSATGSISSPTPSEGKIDISHHTGTSVTASPATDYVFDHWSVEDGGLTVSSTTTNPATFKATSTGGTITANFEDLWNVKGSWDDWTDYSGMPKVSANTYSVTLTLDARTTYNFKIVKRGATRGSGDTYYGKSSTTFTRNGTTSVTGLTTSGGSDNDLKLTTDAAGDYTITYVYNKDQAYMQVSVGFPTAYTVTFDKGTGGATITATASASGTLTSGDYVAAGENITFTQTASTGYTFSNWYDAITGGSVVSTMGASDNILNSIAADATVYSRYTANTYAVTFDYTTNGGTKSSGDDSNDATFDQATISVPTVHRDGYCFNGWYTAASGGVLVIDAEGNLQPNVSVSATQWTGANGKWKKLGTATVYAQYSIPDIEMSPNPTVLNSKKTEKDTVVIHQSFSCTPTGLYNVFYTVGYSANHTQLAPQPTIIYGTVAPGYDSIKMPMDANTYEIVAELRSGSTTRGSGTVIKRDTLNYVVEDQYSVTLNYIVDGIKIRDSREVYAYPSSTATQVKVFMEENGYELDYWEMGAGIDSVDGRRGTESGGVLGLLEYKYIYAHNNGHINLHYKSKDNTVYFFNTFEYHWYQTIMKKYDYGTSDGYWQTTYGADSHGGLTNDTVKSTTTSLEEKRWMASIGSGTTHLAFTNKKMDNYNHFYGSATGNEWARVIYRTDYNSATPMFVPVAIDDDDYYVMNQDANGAARYYRGFWVKFSPNPDSTGYYLHVYNQKAQSGAKLIQTLPLRLTQTGEGGTWELTAKMDLEGGKTYGFKITKATGASTKTWYSYNGTLTAADHEGKVLDGTSDNIGLTTTTAGDYTFHVFCKDFGTIAANNATAAKVQGQLAVTVDYATVSGDYRVIYQDATQTEWIASSSIHPLANGQDTVSFFIRKSSASRVMKIQKYTSSWADFGDPVDLSSIAKDSVYVLFLKQNADADNIEVDSIAFYDGDFYIRTDCVDEHKWDYKQSLDNHRMNPSDYGMSESQPVPFTHYYVHWVDEGGNVKFVVANKYAPCISDTLITDTYATGAGGNLPSDGDAETNIGASIRFMYNKGTNEVNRAYLAGAQGKAYDPDYLKMTTSGSKMGTTDETPEVITEKTFTDLKNFVYQAEIKAKPGLTAKLTAEYNGNTQYFRGSSTEEEEILGGTGDAWQNILLTYDFKTNRLICAWQPSGDSINGDVPINADVMVIRVGQEDAQQIIFKNNDSKLSSVKYIYSVMQFNYDDMVGNMFYWGPTAYEFCMYYVSFPYDVLVNDIMAPGRMGSEWRLQRYNGAKRAEGWFAGDGVTTFWEDVQSGDTLKAYEGYSLLLNRRIFNDGSSSVWANKGAHSKLYMYFPSKDATTGVVANKRVDVVVPSHECTVDRVFDQDKNKPSYQQRNHKIVDSHWNMIGTPLFEDRVASNITEGPTVEGAAEPMQYIYRWNPAGNTLGIQYALDEDWEFRTMYSYMAQYAGTITFVGSAVNKIVAANRETKKKKYTINLELTKDEQSIGRTYVELRENAVDTFLLNEDVYMVKNGVSADLYTYAGAYEAGANVLTVDNHIVPVGVDVKTPGTYVFSMPNNFDGEVVLVDSYAQTRTNLLLEDYEIALPTGTINDRFFLEININKTPTAIDGADGGSLKDGKAHKFIMNDMMYILKDGVLYDARGNRVK